MNAAALARQTHWLCFSLDGLRFALPLDAVIRIVRAAEITPLPRAPTNIAGAIDIAGHILPVFDLRRQLRRPGRKLGLDDQFLIARTARRHVALIIDAALGLVDVASLPPVTTPQVAPEFAHIAGILSLPEGLALIEDLERFLTPAEDAALDAALSGAESAHAG